MTRMIAMTATALALALLAEPAAAATKIEFFFRCRSKASWRAR